MNNDDERDYAEEKYNREFCPECGYSPCILTDEYDKHESARLHELDESDGCTICGENHNYFPKVIDHIQLKKLDEDGRMCERCNLHMWNHKWVLMDTNGFVIYCDKAAKMDN